MKKKVYIIPQSEVTNLGVLGRWMKELGDASLPEQPAPFRRKDKVY